MVIVAERVVGTRTVLGTDYPILDRVIREESGGRPIWSLWAGLCNGLVASVETFRTRRGALAAFEKYREE